MTIRNKFLLLFLFFSYWHFAGAQVFPAEAAVLNYRIVGFSVTESAVGERASEIQVVCGNINDSNGFMKNHIISGKLKNGRAVIELPAFGTQYTWRVLYEGHVSRNVFYHFSTGSVSAVDTAFRRLRVVKHGKKYSDAYVLLDEDEVMYDMKGQPVWYWPGRNAYDSTSKKVFDLKVSPYGTLTMIAGNDPIEVDYNGKLLWQAPNDFILNGDATKHYHHQFSRLANGHYMVLTNEFIICEKDSSGQKIFSYTNGANPDEHTGIFDVLVEFDTKGKPVWVWQSSGYFKKKWIQYLDSTNNIYADAHANAFAYDEKNGFVYVSFKNTSQILKVSYAGAKVIAAFGGDKNSFFNMQHACNISGDGSLYLFNNNVHPDASDRKSQMADDTNRCKPEVLMFKELASPEKKLKEIWHYTCPVIEDNQSTNYRRRMLGRKITVGGNVIELPGKDFFVSTCTPYNNIFILSPEKDIIWEAISEWRPRNSAEWMAQYQYRASIIKSTKELEQLIWKALEGK